MTGTPQYDSLEELLGSWLDAESRHALVASTSVLPARSVALYARWWQIETWLRELAYVELRAGFGSAWINEVKAGFARQAQDAAYTHMGGGDIENPLAYLDYSQLLEVVDRHWNKLGYALFEQRSWDGRQEELKRIRHRIGHLRSPHRDDLGRLEQTLRDLERGAFIAFASYNRKFVPDLANAQDPVTRDWLHEKGSDAKRLLRHAKRQYDITLRLGVSQRPWATWPPELEGASGILWHADFVMPGRTFDISRLWHDRGLDSARPLIVHMLVDHPRHVGFTFATADDAQRISSAIGEAFDTVLMVSRQGEPDYDAYEHVIRASRTIDYRVLSRSGWNIVDETTVPISYFGAGGSVQAVPDW